VNGARRSVDPRRRGGRLSDPSPTSVDQRRAPLLASRLYGVSRRRS
jgi:hypothetical protein